MAKKKFRPSPFWCTISLLGSCTGVRVIQGQLYYQKDLVQLTDSYTTNEYLPSSCSLIHQEGAY